MGFVKLAVTCWETGRPVPAIGADDIWINRDQIVAIEEHIGSNTFDPHIDASRAEHYPCLQLVMSNSDRYLVPLGTYDTPATAMTAIRNFIPLLTEPSSTPPTHLSEAIVGMQTG